MFNRIVTWVYGKELTENKKDLLLNIAVQIIGIGFLLLAINSGLEKTFGK